jgi:transposase-like protein
VQFTFASSLYVLECGHSSAVRANKVRSRGARWHCVRCDSEQLVTDVLTLEDDDGARERPD